MTTKKKVIDGDESTILANRGLGFMRGQFTAPDDFDTMGAAEIEEMFYGNPGKFDYIYKPFRIIPTLSKTKIPQRLSYPTGAEAISRALWRAGLTLDIKLHFYYWSDHQLARGRYEIIRVEYLNASAPADEYPFKLYSRAPQYRWEILVHAVARKHRHRIKEYVEDIAFDKITEWLEERKEVMCAGNDILALFFDEPKDEFEFVALSKLEPVRRK